MPENAYRKGHLYEHLAASGRTEAGDLFIGPNVPYGDGTGYCKRCIAFGFTASRQAAESEFWRHYYTAHKESK